MFSYSQTFHDIYQTYKSLNIMGKIKDAIEPVIDSTDSFLGYDDLEILAKKPNFNLDTNIFDPQKVYIYEDNGSLCLFSKKYINPVKMTALDLDVKDESRKKAFDEIINNLSSANLDKQPLYKLMRKNGYKPGLRYLWYANIVTPYKKLEQEIKKHKTLMNIYKSCKYSVNKVCTFAASETGCRIASLFIITTTAITSGGMLPSLGAGIYLGAVSVALVQQSISRMKLKRLIKEADLIKKYTESYIKKIEISTTKNISFSPINKRSFDSRRDRKPTSTSWSGAIGKHLSTYLLEASVPVLLTTIMPLYGITQGISFFTFIATSSLGVGVGAYLRKLHEQQKHDLKTYIGHAQRKPFIPIYNNVEELEKLVNAQENQIKALKKIPDNLSKEEAKVKFIEDYIALKNNQKAPVVIPKWKEFFSALKEVVNPFDGSKLHDPERFKHEFAESKKQVEKINEQVIEKAREQTSKRSIVVEKASDVSGDVSPSNKNPKSFVSRIKSGRDRIKKMFYTKGKQASGERGSR